MFFSKFLSKKIKIPLKKVFYKNSITLSQAGQDQWVYGEVFNEKKHGYFLDIGAFDGIELSNTYILEKKYQWQGICIEANPFLFEELKKIRSALCLNLCLDRSEGEVDFSLDGGFGGIVDAEIKNKRNDSEVSEIIRLKTTTLMKVLEDCDVPEIIDYLSIDVEGAEERILSDFDFKKYTFRCISIELPTQFLRDLLKDQNYVLIKEIPGLDCFYVHQSFMKEYWNNLYSFADKKHIGIRWK